MTTTPRSTKMRETATACDRRPPGLPRRSRIRPSAWRRTACWASRRTERAADDGKPKSRRYWKRAAPAADGARGDDGLRDRPAHQRDPHRLAAVGRPHLEAHGCALVAGDQVERASVGERREGRAVDRGDQIAGTQPCLARRQSRDRGRDEQAAARPQHGHADPRKGAGLGVPEQSVIARREVAGVGVVKAVEHHRQRARTKDPRRDRRVVVRLEDGRDLAAERRLHHDRRPRRRRERSRPQLEARRKRCGQPQGDRNEQIWTVPLHRSRESVLRHIARRGVYTRRNRRSVRPDPAAPRIRPKPAKRPISCGIPTRRTGSVRPSLYPFRAM